MFNANKLTRVRFGPEHGDNYDSRPAPNPRNRNRSALEDRRGPQFCALSKLGEVKDGPAAHA
jgi:hypothetical protein